MSEKFIYSRKFIILKEDFTNIPKIKPKGHGMIEARENIGKINVNVDRGEKEQIYNIYLVGLDNGEIVEVNLGRIITDTKGKGKIEGTFNPRNVKGSRHSIKKFTSLVIGRGINILLTGYIDKEDGVLDRYISRLDGVQKEKLKEIEEKVENEEESIVKPEFSEEEKVEELEEELEEIEKPEEAEEKIEIEELEEEENTLEIEDRDDFKDVVKEVEEVQEETEELEGVEEEDVTLETEDRDDFKDMAKEIEEEKIETISEDIESDKDLTEPGEEEGDKFAEDLDNHEVENAEEIPRVESIYSQKDIYYMKRLDYKRQMSEYVLSILRFFPYVKPFRIELKGYDWWKIDYTGENIHRGFLPFYNYLFNTYNSYPFMKDASTCHELIKKYGNYLFGIYRDGGEIRYYIYGVPGRFDSLEHPFKGVTGFNTWYETENGFGYWIMYIDPLMGKVIYPLNPMIPSY
ncbi:hypothetical protein KQH90_09525 [Anaerosalibacter bizertensis]|uniref:hypothetical protein n=1 Tax=Anaerosalibacter bizertensis TaxID=932217 RepID=UPI001C0F13B7|nr:hypothetical protein [Anaerosalibacter bizertensis]MBU5294272.1 hypothetical protein [Anaerosalibacter bizertensis]